MLKSPLLELNAEAVVQEGEGSIASKAQGERHMEQGLLRFLLTAHFTHS